MLRKILFFNLVIMIFSSYVYSNTIVSLDDKQTVGWLDSILAGNYEGYEDLAKDPYNIFATRLDRCTPSTGTYIDPRTAQKVNYDIQGKQGDECVVERRFTSGKHLLCFYPKSILESMVQFHLDNFHVGAMKKMEAYGLKHQSAEFYEVAGRKVKNPIEECIKKNICFLNPSPELRKEELNMRGMYD